MNKEILLEWDSKEERAIYLNYSFNKTEAVVFCSIDIFYIEERIGTYDIEFFLNGEIADDYIVDIRKWYKRDW